MVELSIKLDTIFGSLADPTRRDILKRVAKQDLSIGELAKPYSISFAAVAKHVQVLERATLVSKKRAGTEQIVQVNPVSIDFAKGHLARYESLLQARYDRLEKLLDE
jgi:DNA-binding transcriptional ArsR family regulator